MLSPEYIQSRHDFLDTFKRDCIRNEEDPVDSEVVSEGDLESTEKEKPKGEEWYVIKSGKTTMLKLRVAIWLWAVHVLIPRIAS